MFSQGSKVITIDAKVPRGVVHTCFLSKHRTGSRKALRRSNMEPSNFLLTSGAQGKLKGENLRRSLTKEQGNRLLAASETSVGDLLVELFYIN